MLELFFELSMTHPLSEARAIHPLHRTLLRDRVLRIFEQLQLGAGLVAVDALNACEIAAQQCEGSMGCRDCAREQEKVSCRILRESGRGSHGHETRAGAGEV